MKLLCIKDSNCDGVEDKFLVKKNRYYTLKNVNRGLTLFGTENDMWYQLFETGIYTHHSSLFVIPDTWVSEDRENKINQIL